ncbi:MAG: hypothetical protein Q9174_006405, partial [Haloplaca sp. 1 TL-2023]
EHKDIVELLLEKGADVNARNTTDRTPLQEAFMHEQPGIAKLLLEKGASVDTADDELWTPLHQASADNSPLINELLDMGADIEARTGESTIWSSKGHCLATPLYLAAENGREAACKTLLERGANPRCAAIGGYPIHIACVNGHAGVVRILLDAGVDIEERDPMYDETPLIKAATTGQLLVLKLLIERGADMDARSPLGRNALDHARLHRKSGNEEAVDFLEQMYKRRDADREEKRKADELRNGEERRHVEKNLKERIPDEQRRLEESSRQGGISEARNDGERVRDERSPASRRLEYPMTHAERGLQERRSYDKSREERKRTDAVQDEDRKDEVKKDEVKKDEQEKLEQLINNIKRYDEIDDARKRRFLAREDSARKNGVNVKELLSMKEEPFTESELEEFKVPHHMQPLIRFPSICDEYLLAHLKGRARSLNRFLVTKGSGDYRGKSYLELMK